MLGFTKESTSVLHPQGSWCSSGRNWTYIKNEVFKLDDLGTKDEVPVERYVKRAKVLKSIANRIIDFLAQLEDSKTLWEKKKFVPRPTTMTIDHVPESLLPGDLCQRAAVQEWKNLYGWGGGAADNQWRYIDVAFMKSHSYLVLDTAFFDAAFKDHLRRPAAPDGTPVEDLDEATGGLMIKSENCRH